MAAIALLVLVVLTVIWLRPKPLISASIRKQISFIILVPQAPYYVDPSSTSYSSQSGVLEFSVKSHNSSVSYTTTEQAEPDNFTEVPQIYTALINKLNGYASMNTAVGQVNLTHPSELKGGQSAIVTTNGTLMFVRPSQNQTQNSWRAFFNSFSQLH